MDDLYSFDKIVGTPAWYYKKFPGFYNVECYNILARWQGGVRTPAQVEKDVTMREVDDDVTMGETDDVGSNKRKVEEIENPDHGVRPELG
jgi:hypothetical protein